jgi:UDP-glucose 4-epimerase
MKPRRLVITGPLGHIGSALIRSIPQGAFDEVVLVDDLSTQRYASLFDLPAAIPFRFIEADITTFEVATLLDEGTAVVHLAAVTDASSSFADPERVWKVNVGGTEWIAQACARAGSRIVFLSTTSVYGSQAERVDESCPEAELKPQSPYAESKLAAEKALASLGEGEGLEYVTMRFGTIVGVSVGMRFHTAVNKFAWQACMGLPLTVWETALHQVRPYLDLQDGVRAILLALDADGVESGVYNIVTANASVAEIVEAIRSSVPRVEVELVKSPIMNQLSYEVVSRRAGALGFAPEGSLTRAIEGTIGLLRNANAGASLVPTTASG